LSPITDKNCCNISLSMGVYYWLKAKFTVKISKKFSIRYTGDICMNIKKYTLRIIYDTENHKVLDIQEIFEEDDLYTEVEVNGHVIPITREFAESVRELANSNDILGVA